MSSHDLHEQPRESAEAGEPMFERSPDQRREKTPTRGERLQSSRTRSGRRSTIKHRPKSVLFMSNANAVRGQMAEGFLRHRCGPVIEAYSAGLRPLPLHPMAVAAMQEVGIDISRQRSKSLGDYLGRRSFTLAVSLRDQGENAPRLFYGAARIEHWVVPDPIRGGESQVADLGSVRMVRDWLCTAIDSWVDKELGLATAASNR
jgi:arsenate reductase